eukprot:9387349-Alexandrium_andersonii.AAC.1
MATAKWQLPCQARPKLPETNRKRRTRIVDPFPALSEAPTCPKVYEIIRRRPKVVERAFSALGSVSGSFGRA